MNSDHEAEIRASVAAHADLGPGYDDAVAEGLVERIGAEIDRRIDARLWHQVPGNQEPGNRGPTAPAGAQPGVPTPAGVAAQVLADAGAGLDRARQQVTELLYGRREAGVAAAPPPAAADELMGRLTSIVTRLDAIERQLRQSSAG
jgi:hypothetical protein